MAQRVWSRSDATNDLAIIQVETTKSHTVAKFRSAPVRRGEEIFVLGFPFSDLLGNNLTISEGIVSSLAGIGGDVRNFHLSAPVQPGNSGGPVLDASGDLVGTVVAKLDAMKTLELAGTLPENVNFAVHGNMMAILMSSANIEPSYAAPTDDMSAADVSSKAESFTVQVLCN
jgi:serine protease Do